MEQEDLENSSLTKSDNSDAVGEIEEGSSQSILKNERSEKNGDGRRRAQRGIVFYKSKLTFINVNSYIPSYNG